MISALLLLTAIQELSFKLHSGSINYSGVNPTSAGHCKFVVEIPTRISTTNTLAMSLFKPCGRCHFTHKKRHREGVPCENVQHFHKELATSSTRVAGDKSSSLIQDATKDYFTRWQSRCRKAERYFSRLCDGG
jgi:hypothetical protein